MNKTPIEHESQNDQINASLSDERDTALKYYFDAVQTIRHYDGERTGTHRLAVAVLGSLFAFTGSNLFSPTMLVVSSATGLLLACLFFLIAQKHASLITRERIKASVARDVLSSIGNDIIRRIDQSKTDKYQKSRLSSIRVSTLWSAMYATFVLGFMALFLFHILYGE
ncbi:hypothetical protein [Hoeflea poritis]|uniref:SMODS and SLOG-associating 2TM effector domain-containing protein n=1 Tax=Hoeflea poritis TaxID=2993659 RepID=A0ABT4VJS9_9HYPH|nr:hypothetical protein [Hoeflea poritis]MDA4844963.1 hypothetical protein [Hoeflea poritis]